MRKYFDIKVCYVLLIGVLPLSLFAQVSKPTNPLESPKEESPVMKLKKLNVPKSKEEFASKNNNDSENDNAQTSSSEENEEQENDDSMQDDDESFDDELDSTESGDQPESQESKIDQQAEKTETNQDDSSATEEDSDEEESIQNDESSEEANESQETSDEFQGAEESTTKQEEESSEGQEKSSETQAFDESEASQEPEESTTEQEDESSELSDQSQDKGDLEEDGSSEDQEEVESDEATEEEPQEESDAEEIPEDTDNIKEFEQTENSALVGVGWKKNFMEFVDEAKKINEQIKNIIDELRVMRDEKYNEFYKQADEPLDDLFQKVNFEYGVVFEQFELKKLEKFTSYKNSWEELKSRVEELDNLESESFKNLHKLNNKLSEALQESISARENESKMLSETNEQSLLQILNNIKASYKKIKSIQKQDIDNDILKSFTKNIETIKKFISSVKKDLKSLEQKGKDFDLPIKNVKKIFKSQKNIGKEKQKNRRYIFKTSVRVIAFIVSIVKHTVDWFKNIVDTAYSWIIKKKEKIEKVSDPLVEKTEIELKKLKENVKELEKEKKAVIKKTKKLEDIKENRISQIKEKLLLAKEESIKKEALALPKEIVSDLKKIAKPKWRAAIEYLFDKFLDAIDFLVVKVKMLFNSFYNLFAKEKWEKFIKDVKKRVKKIEQKKMNKNMQQYKIEDDIDDSEDFPEQMGPVSKEDKEGSIPLISTE